MTALRAASATDAGRVRTSNQDLALAASDLAAVADGMGGHAGGEVAAAYRGAQSCTRPSTATTAPTGSGRRPIGRTGEIFDRSERDRDLRGMGTTLTAAAVVSGRDGERLAVVNVGDSRAYLLDRRPAQPASPRTTASSRRWSATVSSRPMRPRSTRTGTSSPARSASTRGSRSTPGCSTSSPAAACCSAATG